MSKIQFIKEPGYVFDLFYLFTLHFNEQYFIEKIDKHMDVEKYTKGLRQQLNEFGEVSPELYPFFALREDKKSFMSACYFAPYLHRFATDYNLQLVQRDLADYDQVIENMLRFYFIGITAETIAECRHSVKKISRLIVESSYSGNLKCALYAFFIDPVAAIQKLIYELIEKSFVVTQQYERQAAQLLQAQNDFVLEDFVEFCEKENAIIVDTSMYDTIMVSFCVNNARTITTRSDDEALMAVMGLDFKVVMALVKDKRQGLNLRDFGTAISEDSRQEILELLLSREEITVKDVEEEFGFTGPNAYYHLALMVKAGVLKTRSRGRTVLYSLNCARFDELCEWFSRYTTHKEE